MKLEVIKSYTLAILVGISLILSFSLWSYQPKDEKLEEDETLNEEQIDLGGKVETRKTLVQPTQIIFEVDDNYYGFTNPVNMETLYKDMGSWVLYNVRSSEANGRPNNDEQVEVIYPEELPMGIIPSLFTVNNIDNVNVNLNLPENLSFQRMYITSNSDQTLTLIFLSTDGQTQIRADVNNAQKYELLSNYMTTLDGLEEYDVLEEEEFPIYFPINPIKTQGYQGSISKLEPEILKNALFTDPSGVTVNVTEDMEIWYQDSLRLMKVFRNELNMEYVHPQETRKYKPITFLELLDKSIAKVNGYKGWVHDYHLESLNTLSNNIRYQMYYRGYPVFNYDGLSTIEQLWRDNELEEHRQPLFKISISVSESYDLDSGKEIISHIKENTTYKLNEIEDIQVGYSLGYSIVTDEHTRLSLTPAWYIKTNGQWRQISVDEEQRKGVS